MNFQDFLREKPPIFDQIEELCQENNILKMLLDIEAKKNQITNKELLGSTPHYVSKDREKFRSIFESSSLGILISSLSDKSIIYANKKACNTLAVSKHNLLNWKLSYFYSDTSEEEKLWQNFQENGYLDEYELKCKKADGSKFSAMISIRQFNYQGKLALLIVINDNSKHQRTEVKGNRFFNLSLDLFCDGANSDYIHRVLAGENISVENKLTFKTGEIKYAKTRLVPEYDEDDQFKRYYCIITDISDRQQAEDDLSIGEENYRSIFENALEGIFQSTPNGHYIKVNPAMAKIHGYDSPQEMMAKVQKIEQQIYVDPNVWKKFKTLLQKQDKVENFEYQVYRQDGRIIWIEESTRAVRNRHGNLLYYQGTVQDITKRKQKEEALKCQIKKLRISIDQEKREKEVKSIVESEYFQQLKADLKDLRSKY